MQKTENISNQNSMLVGQHKMKFTTRVWRHRDYYLMLLPALVYIIMFNYAPMYGLLIAFKDFRVTLGIDGSKWVGLKHFTVFFKSYNFKSLLTNTLTLSLYKLIAGFPIPIFIALVINELKGKYKSTLQTILYAPHFMSTVVIVGMIKVMFSMSNGIVNHAIEAMGGTPIYFWASTSWFRHLYVWTGIWQEMGWAAIIYIAALSGVDPGLHEAASIDGATRLQRVIHINIPTILPTIIITLILNVGSLISVGYEKVFLMQTDLNIDASEVISTYVYKRGIRNSDYSASAAIGLFNNVTNVTLLLIANTLSRRVTKTSLF